MKFGPIEKDESMKRWKTAEERTKQNKRRNERIKNDAKKR
jgi:hypothetical protein